jgi:5-(carboxyamino)imidazole ribonucleotide mutase
MLEVLILVGSSSDLAKAEVCTKTLDEFSISYQLHVASAHRTPELTDKYIKEAEAKGASVIIAMAGMAAHLPGVVASKTLLPVIGVPLNASPVAGIDAMYSVLMMPSGFPVATVGIDAAKNAALLAVHILSIKRTELKHGLQKMRDMFKESIIKANEGLE